MAFVNPVQFYTAQGWRVTSPFGWRKHPITGAMSHHNGTDFGDKPAGYPIRTPFPGLVTAAQYYPSRGNTVVVRIDRPQGAVKQLFQHLQAFRCSPGSRVQAGDVVGLNGSTGDSSGAHLHYELRYDGNPWGGVWGDPAKFEMEVFELKVAIVVNALVDILIVEPLAKHLDAPIFLREACGQLNAEKVIVAGGDAKIFERPGAEVVDLSGTDRWETAAKVGEYYRGL